MKMTFTDHNKSWNNSLGNYLDIKTIQTYLFFCWWRQCIWKWRSQSIIKVKTIPCIINQTHILFLSKCIVEDEHRGYQCQKKYLGNSVFITITGSDTSAIVLLVPVGIVHPGVSAFALQWFIRDIYFQFPIKVIY